VSNVLIGIIGVILFIGLALAGALILGDDFRSSNSASKAAATIATMQQISSAISMYQLKTGRTMIASADNITLLQPRFLKSYPAANPISGETYRINDATANIGTLPVAMVMTPIGTDERARDACIAIEEQTGTGTPDMMPKSDFGATFAVKPRAGCFLYSQTSNYYAYVGV
jgi:hypothetical protein